MRTKEAIRKDIEEVQIRLNAYKERELMMLSQDGVQSYSIRNRSLSRYNPDLASIQKMIAQLSRQLRELEAELKGQRPRRAVGVVPCDW